VEIYKTARDLADSSLLICCTRAPFPSFILRRLFTVSENCAMTDRAYARVDATSTSRFDVTYFKINDVTLDAGCCTRMDDDQYDCGERGSRARHLQLPIIIAPRLIGKQ